MMVVVEAVADDENLKGREGTLIPFGLSRRA